ncbi:hypothetical protein Poli38472_000445 [Pythium oligandrum]|uniref:ADP-ribosylglycohydrolase n=1 Tax=Pythium oligandrum TaxID=41045 RepID=A0A8K1FJ53_PYTOL|nr:hypothetical protein Poli38472_000445 [Pythium oligandrum]|eukprot:TMW60403.1 hypothetical protein Poli38472_000445 [Pythium oligandrum]
MALALPKHRALAAVVGGFVADAASMGLHWIYDPDKMKELVSAAPHPEFHEPPACPFYQYESGVLSPYGDEVLPLLEDVATRGAFVPEEFALVSYRAAKAYKGRLNHVFRELVTKGDAGATYPNLATESKDLHGGIKVPVLVAKYLDDVSTLVAKTKEATKVHQIGDEAEEAAVASALLLHQIVHGVSIREAVASLTTNDQVGSTTRATVQEVLDAVAKKEFADATAAIDKYGKSCGLPGVLKGSLFVLLTSNGYVDAVRANMVAGGDNCSRSILIGACAAAAAVTEGAMDPVPAEWKHKTKSYTQVQAFAERLLT